MNRLAFFVEGYTEIVFVEKLVEEIAGKQNVIIEKRVIRGGSNAPRTVKVIKAAKSSTGQQYYVLLFDCGGDDQVKTRILDEHDNLTKKNYIRIIGIRDVRPRYSYAEIPKLEAYLPKYIKTSWAPVTFILSIMEMEAWFLAETTHYQKIDPSITVAKIKTRLGFDPENDNMEKRLNPTDDLKACYAIGKKLYEKSKAKTTVDALDFALIYMALRSKINYLDELISAIDEFLS